MHKNLWQQKFGFMLSFFWSTDRTPDEIGIRIHASGDSMEIICSVLKVCDYSIDDIFEKELYFLLPFHLFVYEKNFEEYNEDEEKLTQLRNEYDRLKRKLKGY